jgi:6-phosphogluconolactonase (cycloisomerase 2 family)
MTLRRATIAAGLGLVCSVWVCTSALAAPVFLGVPGSPVATDRDPRSVAFSPSGGLLATANYSARTVSMFAVAPDGAVSQVPGSPFGTSDAPVSVAFSPSGHLLATANYAGTVSVFSIGPTGALSVVSGSPFTTGAGADSVAFSPSGGLLATANSQANTVSLFSVASSGALTQIAGSPFPAGAVPDSVAFSPSGGLLATANSQANTVSLFSVASSGALAPTAGSPFATGPDPHAVAFSPVGGLLATANSGANSMSVFSIGSAGSATQVSGSPFATGVFPVSVAFSPSGDLLTTADAGSDQLSVFSVQPGPVSKVSGTPLNLCCGPKATDTTPDAVAFSPTGGLLAATNQSTNTVSLFSLAPFSARIKINTAHARVIDGRTTVKLRCTGRVPGGSCRGTVLLKIRRPTARRVHHHRAMTYHTIVLARTRYAIASGHGSPTVLKLTRLGRRLLARAQDHRLPVHATATLIGGSSALRDIVLIPAKR